MTTAAESVRMALVSALGAQAAFVGVEGLQRTTGRASLPQVTIDDPQSSDWGTKSARGREVRTAISMRVARGQAMRLPAMIAAAESVGEAMAGDLGGWRVASAVLLRSRSFDASDGTRPALVEHRVRVLEV